MLLTSCGVTLIALLIMRHFGNENLTLSKASFNQYKSYNSPFLSDVTNHTTIMQHHVTLSNHWTNTDVFIWEERQVNVK